ncbi:MAG: long-chain fatty acid--CoA ligase [Frankiales bacterium]|nr:long-chain fatty acid--CoA ligase [Frankiales bacterium]
MGQLLHLGDVIATNALMFPDNAGGRDLARSMTFRQWNDRACRLANGLIGLGLQKGDRVAILAYNCIEWLEIYTAVAKAGLVAVPVNFRLVGQEIQYIIENAGAAAFIVQDALVAGIESIRADLPLADGRYIHFGAGAAPHGFVRYEDLIAGATSAEPSVDVGADDPFILLYTSGTTGKPKGAIRSGGSLVLHGYIQQIDFGFTRDDIGLLVMPMFHANSVFFLFAFAACGAGCCVYDRRSFDPEHLLRTLAGGHFTFTSLVPTHYIMMLGLPNAIRQKLDVASVTKLLISSAPARRQTKLELMDYFRNTQLYEAYGSTEMGWATMLRPAEQLTRLGSVGREMTGTGRIRLLDPAGHEVPEGEPGEIYARTPYAFDGYWNLPEKTAEAFRGDYCSVGDIGRRDSEGYYYLVDRKSNMIISGGENVYPSEVEQVLGTNPQIKDVAVIGIPDAKWGEATHAVVILHPGADTSEAEIIAWCKDRIAGFKRPKSISFVTDEEMPRTATGKILHRVLRERHAQRESAKG